MIVLLPNNGRFEEPDKDTGGSLPRASKSFNDAYVARLPEEPPEWDLRSLNFNGTKEDLELKRLEIAFLSEKIKTKLNHLPTSGSVDVKQVRSVLAMIEELRRPITIVRQWYKLMNVSGQSPPKMELDNQALDPFIVEAEKPIRLFDEWFLHLLRDNGKEARRIKRLCPRDKTYLSDLIRTRKHRFSEAEEADLRSMEREKGHSIRVAYGTIFQDSRIHLGGREHSVSTLKSLFASPDPELRVAAAQAHMGIHAEKRQAVFEVISSNSRYLHWLAERLGFLTNGKPDIRAMAFSAYRVSKTFIDDRQRATYENREIGQEIFLRHSHMLGVDPDRVHFFAPLDFGQGRIPYREAIKIYLQALSAFHPRAAATLKEILETGKLHARPTLGKLAVGRTIMVGPWSMPFPLDNYGGDLSSVLHLKHELGHTMAQNEARHLNPNCYEASAILMETFALFFQILTFDQLCKNMLQQGANKEKVKLARLHHLNTILWRPAYMAKVEIDTHEMLKNGAKIDQIEGNGLAVLRDFLGKKINVPDYYRHEVWSLSNMTKTDRDELLYLSTYTPSTLEAINLALDFFEDPNSACDIMELMSFGGLYGVSETFRKKNKNFDSAERHKRPFVHMEEELAMAA